MNAPASVWAGLGQRQGVAPAPSLPVDQKEDFERPPVRRVVDAATATPLASAPAEDHPKEPGTPEENPMARTAAAKKPRKPRAPVSAAPQFQICALLLANGDLSREQLLADVSCERKAFNQGLFNAKQAGRIVYIEKADKYHLTKEGRDWTTGGANLANQQASEPAERTRRKATKPRPRAPKALPLLIPPPAEVVVEPSFRCAVFSDGGFFLAKGGQRIELDAKEHSQMLRYLERMAEAAS